MEFYCVIRWLLSLSIDSVVVNFGLQIRESTFGSYRKFLNWKILSFLLSFCKGRNLLRCCTFELSCFLISLSCDLFCKIKNYKFLNRGAERVIIEVMLAPSLDKRIPVYRDWPFTKILIYEASVIAWENNLFG